jgi:small subunit ribosomal protein S16
MQGSIYTIFHYLLILRKMPVKIRLQRKGTKKRPFYHVVVADSRSPRDGKFIEKIGTYNPLTTPATIILNVDKAFDWLEKGAQPTDTAHAILKFKGVFFKKHLQRGVSKNAFTQEKADELFAAWADKKAIVVEKRKDDVKAEQEALRLKIFGTPKAPKAKAVEAPAEEEGAE